MHSSGPRSCSSAWGRRRVRFPARIGHGIGIRELESESGLGQRVWAWLKQAEQQPGQAGTAPASWPLRLISLWWWWWHVLRDHWSMQWTGSLQQTAKAEAQAEKQSHKQPGYAAGRGKWVNGKWVRAWIVYSWLETCSFWLQYFWAAEKNILNFQWLHNNQA